MIDRIYFRFSFFFTDESSPVNRHRPLNESDKIIITVSDLKSLRSLFATAEEEERLINSLDSLTIESIGVKPPTFQLVKRHHSHKHLSSNYWKIFSALQKEVGEII